MSDTLGSLDYYIENIKGLNFQNYLKLTLQGYGQSPAPGWRGGGGGFATASWMKRRDKVVELF